MPEIIAQSSGWSTQYGSVPASSVGTTVTASASTNTKGTLVELTASTEHDGHWLSVTILPGATGGLTGLLDILIGAATEQVLIADLPVTVRTANEGGGGPFLFPIFIPKGSRLSAKYQNSTGSATVEVILHQFGGSALGPLAGCTYVDRYGATATSRGTNIDPGGVANTYVSAEITASTSRPIRWMVLALQNADTAFAAITPWNVQVMIGEATAQVIAGDFYFQAGATTDNTFPYMHAYLPIFIPTGSRLSVQAKTTSTTDGDRDLFVSLFGCG